MRALSTTESGTVPEALAGSVRAGPWPNVGRAAWGAFALLALASCLLPWVATPAVLLAFLIAHGFATAAENVMLPLMVAECFGTAHMARIYGVLMVALLPGGVLGPVFAGPNE